MRKGMKILIMSSACLMISGGGAFSTQAAMNLETDSPVAGASVAINNYYAGSLNPEEELAQAFSSKEALAQAVTAGRSEEVPVVTATSKSAYDNVAISRVSNYVNVRAEANTTSAVVGKIYNNCAATILSTVNGEGGTWYQIQSGNVKGYIKSQYFITGSEAEAVARQVGTPMARVSSSTSLRLREKPSLDSRTLDLLSPDAEYVVIGEEGDFAKISVDNDLVGYVFKDYINIDVKFNQAVSTQEEQQKAAEAAKRKQEADDAIKKMEDAKKTEGKQTEAKQTTEAVKQTTKAPAKNPDSAYNGTIEANPNSTTKAPEATKAPAQTKAPTKAPETTKAASNNGPGGGSGPGGPGGGSGGAVSATRSAVIAYAKQFLGNPYVYGGTSLTDGADCSGFTQSIFSHFGITTGRSSRDQAARGREISVDSAQPGDLLFYASGNYINHVAIYIGGGQVIHSSTPATGITISPSNYRTPCKAVSFLD